MSRALPDGVLDLDRAVVERGGETTSLSTAEVRLLRYLADHDRPVPQDELLEKVWGYAPTVRSRTVRVTVGRVRNKIERDPKNPEVLRTVTGEGYQLAAPAIEPERPVPGGLPPELDAFLGRDAELERLVEARASGRRLLAIVGHGGVGKTRLAAAFLRGVEHGGTYLGLDDADAVGVTRAVAAALHVEPEGDPTDAIGRALAPRGAEVWVLDLLEPPDDLAPRLLRWLALAPELTLVVVSRRRLGVRGEVVLELGPLDDEASGRLFVDRCAEVGVEPDDAATARVVARLGGHPLALELAAAWTEAVGVGALLEHLDPEQLEVDDPSRPDRHRSLGAALDGSWARLSQEERGALARLSVCPGWFGLDTAQALVEGPPVPVLRGLRRAALVRLDRGRYEVPRVVRTDAEARLADEAARGRTLHLGHMVEVAEAQAPKLTTADRDEVIDALEAERPGLEAALSRAPGVDPALGARLVEAIEPWLRRAAGWAALVECVVDALSTPPVSLRAVLGEALQRADRLDEAEAVLRAALDDASPDERSAVGRALGHVLLLRGSLDEGVHALRAAEEDASDPVALARARLARTRVIRRRASAEEARALVADAVEVARASGDRSLYGQALLDAATVELEAAGDEDAALALYQQARDQLEADGDPHLLSAVHRALGQIRVSQERWDAARADLDRAEHEARRAGSRRLELLARWRRTSALEVNLGEHEAARVELSALLAEGEGLLEPQLLRVLRAQVGMACADAGDDDEARAWFARCLDGWEEDASVYTPLYRLVTGTGALGLGDLDDARARLGPVFGDKARVQRRGFRIAVPMLALAGHEGAARALGDWEPSTAEEEAAHDLARGHHTERVDRLAQTSWGVRMMVRAFERGTRTPRVVR